MKIIVVVEDMRRRRITGVKKRKKAVDVVVVKEIECAGEKWRWKRYTVPFLIIHFPLSTLWLASNDAFQMVQW